MRLARKFKWVAGFGCWKSCPPFHSEPILSFEVVRGPTRWASLVGFRGVGLDHMTSAAMRAPRGVLPRRRVPSRVVWK